MRGVAVALMILYHLIFDLEYFAVLKIDASKGPALWLARATVLLFLLLVGLSLHLSRSRALERGQAQERARGEAREELSRFSRGLMKRSAGLLCIAMAITAASYLAIGRGFIVFGALHLIGLSLVLAYPFLMLGRGNFLIGMIIVLIGTVLPDVRVDHPWLIWIGLAPSDFYSLDYVPVFPWFGVVLIGIALGDLLYPLGRRRFELPDISESVAVRPLAFLGRVSLLVYLVHQPLMILVLYLLGFSTGILRHI